MNKEVETSLNIDAILQVPFDKYEKNFVFVVDGKKYYTTRFEADLISPLIRKMHFVDESLDSFIIDTRNQFQDCVFSDFLSLLSFKPHKVELKKQYFYKFLFALLENQEESEKYSLVLPDSITNENVLQRIHEKQAYYHSIDVLYDEINFIAHNFNEIDKNELSKLDIEIIRKIISSDQLLIKDEDSLLDFIINLYIQDKQYGDLFEKVFFLNVTNEGLSRFYEVYDYNDISSSVWKSIFDRVIHSFANDFNVQNRNYIEKNAKVIAYDPNRKLNGIIKYLLSKTNGDLIDNGIINIQASSSQYYYSQQYTKSPRKLLNFNDLGRSSMWSPSNHNHEYLIYDFKNIKVKLTNYTLHTPTSPTKDYPRSWIVECSNDCKNWIQIDERRDENEMNGCGRCHTFSCSHDQPEFFRYVKFTTNGPCWNGYDRYYFDVSAIEFYGCIIE